MPEDAVPSDKPSQRPGPRQDKDTVDIGMGNPVTRLERWIARVRVASGSPTRNERAAVTNMRVVRRSSQSPKLSYPVAQPVPMDIWPNQLVSSPQDVPY